MQTYPAICFVKIGLAVLLSAAQEQGARESDDAAHGPGDCHIHVILLKEAKLTCDRSLVDSSRQWGDVPVILASVQGYYRPPRG